MTSSSPRLAVASITSAVLLAVVVAGAQDYEATRRAAEQGHAGAQHRLGLAYGRGEGVPQDYEESVRWFRRAAEQGHANAQDILGQAFRGGAGGVPQDHSKAVHWFRRAAEQGHAGAQHHLGLVYSRGEGVPQDYGESVRWHRRAAEQGYADAQTTLGAAYVTGTGVPQDHGESVRWFRRASEQGHANAQFFLGAAYLLGLGVPQDFVSAHMWLNIATAAGSAEARWARDSVAERMTREQIAEAQARAAGMEQVIRIPCPECGETILCKVVAPRGRGRGRVNPSTVRSVPVVTRRCRSFFQVNRSDLLLRRNTGRARRRLNPIMQSIFQLAARQQTSGSGKGVSPRR